MPHLRAGFAHDESAEFTVWTLIQILIFVSVPIALAIFWYQYLRRIANDQEAREGPMGQKLRPAAAPQRAADITVTCGRCGLRVKPPRGGPATCPNCMNLL